MWTHQCTKPKPQEYPLQSLPRDAREALIRKKLDKGRLLICNYCGNIWTEKWGYFNDKAVKSQILVGVDDSFGAREPHWVILDTNQLA